MRLNFVYNYDCYTKQEAAAYYTKIVLKAEHNASDTLYLRSSDNSQGTATVIDQILLVEYYCSEAFENKRAIDAVRCIHSVIQGNIGDQEKK